MREEMDEDKLAYPDLQDPDFIFEALLGHGLFSKKIPPCFTSENLLRYISEKKFDKSEIKAPKVHSFVRYRATRNTSIPRLLSIPHPESYWGLCKLISKYWDNINLHNGKPNIKFSNCHVGRVKDKKYIFEMNYKKERYEQEEVEIDYALGAEYVVEADISTCFPSIYSHSISWAIMGKTEAKKNREPTWKSKTDSWANDLDFYSRSINDNETNGLLIGPDTSNIISEIILTQVDVALQERGFKKVIRYIDDYRFYAKNENDARDFLKQLEIELHKFELTLNEKKTKIISFSNYIDESWVSELNQFSFPEKQKDETLGFTTVNNYIEYALRIARKYENYAVLKYAIKVIGSKENLSIRAKRLYIKKISVLTLNHPYLLPLLESYVFKFKEAFNELIDESGVLFQESANSFITSFINSLLKKSLAKGVTDGIAFGFYFAIIYKITIDSTVLSESVDFILDLEDCVSMVLLWKYCIPKKDQEVKCKKLKERAKEVGQRDQREKDALWLFIYEVLSSEELTNCKEEFLSNIKKSNVSFFKKLSDIRVIDGV